jgi:GNAT superfamily N-acetyltransferase
VQEWARDRAGDLAALAEECFPAEALTEDELVGCCWDDPDPGVVLALGDGAVGVACVVARGTTAFLKLLAVSPHARRLGHGRALLAAAESWAASAGCTSVVPGPSAPFYLWPGVDVRWTPALVLFEAAGYRPVGAELNMSCPTSYRSPPPDGVVVERVIQDADAAAVVAFCAAHFPHWVAEVERGIEHAACLAARDTSAAGAVVGFCCHSVNRAGWIGPMATDPACRGRGVGRALLGAACADLRAAGHADAEIAWVGPVGFYARTAGASASRVFRTLLKPLA